MSDRIDAVSGAPLLRMRLPHQVERLPELLDAIERLAGDQGWDDAFRAQLLLVVEELVVNAMSYGGCEPGAGWVEIGFVASHDGLDIQISDNGKAYDPFSSAPEPDLDLDLDDRPIGGLGVHLVKEMTDRHSYQRSGDENRVALFKRWSAA